MYERAQPCQGQGPGQIAEAALEWGRWRWTVRRGRNRAATALPEHHRAAGRDAATTRRRGLSRARPTVAYAYATAGTRSPRRHRSSRRGFLLNETTELAALRRKSTLTCTRLRRHGGRGRDGGRILRNAEDPAGPGRMGSRAGVPGRTEVSQVELLSARPATGSSRRQRAAVTCGTRGSSAAPGPQSSIALVSPPAAEKVTLIPLAGASEAALEEQLAVFRAGYEQRRAAPEAWHAALDDVVGRLGREVGQALMGVIPAGSDIVVIGGGALGLSSAARRAAARYRSGRRRYLLDQVRIRHAPNIASVRQSQPGTGPRTPPESPPGR